MVSMNNYEATRIGKREQLFPLGGWGRVGVRLWEPRNHRGEKVILQKVEGVGIS